MLENQAEKQAISVVMIPSASAGLGHVGRTAALGRAIKRLDGAVEVEYLLDSDRLRPAVLEAATATGFRVSLLPPRPRESRDAIARSCLGRASVIVDDTQGYLIPLKRAVPEAAWVHLPMYPLADELYTSWPALVQTDAVLWAYPPGLDFPPELAMLGDLVHRTGPFLELDGVPDRAAARKKLAVSDDDELVVYAVRGMTFGLDFGQAVLGGLFAAVKKLRATRPGLRLALLAVSGKDELRGAGLPNRLPDWVSVRGVVPPEEMPLYLRAADVAVTEGSSMTQEAAALGTPVLMVPGTIFETWLLGTRLLEAGAARVTWIEKVTAASLGKHLAFILGNAKGREAMLARARAFVAGGGGAEAAARLVLELGRGRRRG